MESSRGISLPYPEFHRHQLVSGQLWRNSPHRCETVWSGALRKGFSVDLPIFIIMFEQGQLSFVLARPLQGDMDILSLRKPLKECL